MMKDSPPTNSNQYERVWARGNKAFSILALTHPTAVLVFGSLTVILVFLAERHWPDPAIVLLLAAAMALGQAIIGLTNEIFDFDLDKRVKPWRALPAGLITLPEAATLSMACLLLALLLSAFVSATAMLGLAFGIGVGVAYNWRLKRTIFSWVPYAVAYPSVPVWVWLSLGIPVREVLGVYLIASPLAVAVHMINQLRDYDQDLALGIRGLVQHLGKPRAVSVCFKLLVLGPLPAIAWQLLDASVGSALLLVVAVCSHWLLVVPLVRRYRRSPNDTKFQEIFRRLQISGPVMLLAWLVTVR